MVRLSEVVSPGLLVKTLKKYDERTDESSPNFVAGFFNPVRDTAWLIAKADGFRESQEFYWDKAKTFLAHWWSYWDDECTNSSEVSKGWFMEYLKAKYGVPE